ncbi:hypothetical protein OG589_17275 [Sphaerisporangium sp. NBC_01403]
MLGEREALTRSLLRSGEQVHENDEEYDGPPGFDEPRHGFP